MKLIPKMPTYTDTETGEVLTQEQFDALPEGGGFQAPQQPQLTRFGTQRQVQPGQTNFLQRLRLGFGGAKAKAEQQRLEREAGLKGKVDVGDIADIAGGLLPTAGATLGAIAASPTALFGGPVGPAIGAGIGATSGEAVKQAVGRFLGTREEIPLSKELTEVGITGGLTAVGSKVLSSVGKYIANRLPKFLGLFTGETEVINSALRNPTAADLGIKQGDTALRRVVQEGAQKSVQIRDAFLSAHKLAFEKLVGRFGDRGLVSAPQKLGTKALLETNKKGLHSGLEDILKENGVLIRGKTLDFRTSKIIANPGEKSKIEAAWQAADKWSDFTLKGINEYKQLVGKLTRFADETGIPSKSPTLGKFYHKLDELIKKQLPEKLAQQYGQINKRFTDTIDLYDDMVDAFNRGDPFTKLSQAFGKNKDSLRMVLDFYAEKSGVDVPAVVAGRELAAERSAAFGFLNPREWVDLLVPPKVQAGIVTKVARTQQATKRIFPERLRSGVRGAVPPVLQRVFHGPDEFDQSF